MSATGQLGTAWRKRDYHRQWLWREANRLFDFFQNRAFNPLGGFHELDAEGRPINPGNPVRGIHSTARMVHCFAIGSLLGRPGSDAIVDHGMKYLWEKHRDHERGGYHWSLDNSGLLDTSKLTVFASYNGVSVADLQALRAEAREAGVVIKVVKNRLVRVAMGDNTTYKAADTSALVGQLLYAFSADDEVAPAKVLNDFAKTHPALELVAGFSGEGLAQNAADVKALASLPSKNQLIAEVVALLLSPVHDVTNALYGNLHALLDGVEAKATA